MTMRHLTRADYTEMPWANGRGSTIEILRKPMADGAFLWRFSMATVAEDGPFSIFPNIDRNLTVIDGPGFDLIGPASYRVVPLKPVAFSGDVQVAATNVIGKAIDFNVMTQRSLTKPMVSLVRNETVTVQTGATLCLFSLGAAQFGLHILSRHDFIYDAETAHISGGPALAVQLFGAH